MGTKFYDRFGKLTKELPDMHSHADAVHPVARPAPAPTSAKAPTTPQPPRPSPLGVFQVLNDNIRRAQDKAPKR